MPRSRDDVPLGVKYEVAVLYADQVGDRQAAREIGVSTTSIGNWRQGKKHNKATAQKVERWFARSERKLYQPDTSERDVLLAVKAIVKHLPRKDGKRTAHRIADILREEYARGATPVPRAIAPLDERIDTELT